MIIASYFLHRWSNVGAKRIPHGSLTVDRTLVSSPLPSLSSSLSSLSSSSSSSSSHSATRPSSSPSTAAAIAVAAAIAAAAGGAGNPKWRHSLHSLDRQYKSCGGNGNGGRKPPLCGGCRLMQRVTALLIASAVLSVHRVALHNLVVVDRAAAQRWRRADPSEAVLRQAWKTRSELRSLRGVADSASFGIGDGDEYGFGVGFGHGGGNSDGYAQEEEDNDALLGTKTTFLLGIFSTMSESDRLRRKLIRDTYLSRDEVPPGVCSLADFLERASQRNNSRAVADSPLTLSPPSAAADGHVLINADEHDADLVPDCRIVYAFVVGANPTGETERILGQQDKAKAAGEAVKFDSLTIDPASLPETVLRASPPETDVVYLNIKENMEDGKTPTWFGYASCLSELHNIDYVGKTDSDTLINLEQLVRFVNRDLPPAPYNRRTYGGRPLVDFATSGSYMAGEFYFASSDLATYVSRTLTTNQRAFLTRKVEDSDFGSYVLSHTKPIRMVVVSNCVFWYHPLKSDHQWNAVWNARNRLPPTHRERNLYIPEWMMVAVRLFG